MDLQPWKSHSYFISTLNIKCHSFLPKIRGQEIAFRTTDKRKVTIFWAFLRAPLWLPLSLGSVHSLQTNKHFFSSGAFPNCRSSIWHCHHQNLRLKCKGVAQITIIMCPRKMNLNQFRKKYIFTAKQLTIRAGFKKKIDFVCVDNGNLKVATRSFGFFS